MEELKIVHTADGSSTLYSEKYKASYHSLNGALTESMYVFIKSGFEALLPAHQYVAVLEVGLGTCLNAAITARSAESNGVKVWYMGIELSPPSAEILKLVGYESLLDSQLARLWNKIIAAPPAQNIQISPWFTIAKNYTDFNCWVTDEKFDLIYFDAFAPDDQPEMWNLQNFMKMYEATNSNGLLVTYSAKGLVKQNLRNSGFKVERLPGPPGKRHIVRASKP